MTHKKLEDTFKFAKYVLQHAAPARYETQRDAIDFFEKSVLNAEPAQPHHAAPRVRRHAK